MRPGFVVRWVFPQADGKLKERPAVLLSRFGSHGDWLVCGVSSKVWSFDARFHVLVEHGHPDLVGSGLSFDAILRADLVDTIPAVAIKDVLGEVSLATVRSLRTKLIQQLQLEADLAL